VIGDTFPKRRDGLEWRDVAGIAAERGTEPSTPSSTSIAATYVCVVAQADRSRTRHLGARAEALAGSPGDGRRSDAGPTWPDVRVQYPTGVPGDCLRNRKLVPVERPIRVMTRQPAELFGPGTAAWWPTGCGRFCPCSDPETVALTSSPPLRTSRGTPAGCLPSRLEWSRGLVNGVETIVDASPPGDSGALLRLGA